MKVFQHWCQIYQESSKCNYHQEWIGCQEHMRCFSWLSTIDRHSKACKISHDVLNIYQEKFQVLEYPQNNRRCLYKYWGHQYLLKVRQTRKERNIGLRCILSIRIYPHLGQRMRWWIAGLAAANADKSLLDNNGGMTSIVFDNVVPLFTYLVCSISMSPQKSMWQPRVRSNRFAIWYVLIK